MVLGSKVKGMVLLWPLRVVAAKVIFCFVRSGMRKVEVQPAPRMRMETDEEDAGGGVVGVVSCVIGFGGGVRVVAEALKD